MISHKNEKQRFVKIKKEVKMNKIIVLLPVLFLAACGGADKNGFTDGTFKATMGETKIDILVKCISFDSDTEFVFRSDNGFGNEDTNGDGILLSVQRMKIGKDKTPLPIDGIMFMLTINGEKYGSDQASLMGLSKGKDTKQTWIKESNVVRGKEILTKADEIGSKEYTINYEVICK